MHGTRGGWHEGAWRVGAIVSAKEAALQLHRALWGSEFGGGSDRHHALQSHATENARKQHRKRERPLCINWGLGKPLFSGSRLCPPPCTSTRHVTRERGLVESRRRAALPFVLPVPGEHMPLPVLSRRACAVPAASVPVCERVFVFALLERYVLRGRRTFFAFVDTTLDMGSTRSVPCWLNP